MLAQAIYWACGSIVTLGASAVLFGVHKAFRKRAGLEPPDIVYEKDYFGHEDKDKVLWRTPLFKDVKQGDLEFANGILFLLKYGLIGASSFFAATAVIMWTALSQ